MKWFNNLKVAYKILLSCFMFIVLIITISGYGLYSSKISSNIFSTFYVDRFIPVRQLNRIMRDILQIRVNMAQEQLSAENGDWDEVEQRMQSSKELTEAYNKEWDGFMATEMDAEERALADKWVETSKIPATVRAQYGEALQNRNLEESERLLAEWTVRYRELRAITDELINMQNRIAEEIMVEQERMGRLTMIINISMLIASILIGTLITFILANAIKNPVSKGLEFAKKLAKGDFTTRVDLDQDDELGDLGNELNTTADQLEKVISEIIVAGQNLVQAVQEISSGNENLSQRTSEQASSLEEIASTIEELVSTINQNAENSETAAKLSQDSEVSAKEGSEVVQDAVSAINEINESSKKIEEIISVINDIAFQTNLLALNAAVEAARAGEQGRGFAVVAGEVRNLAQRSGNAAKEIGDLIKDTILKVDRGTTLANQSGESLKGILKSINEVGKFIREIAAASEEQRQGSQQINTAVEELDSMTQQNAGLVEETASASEEMANQAQELLVMMEQFTVRDQIKSDSYNAKHKEIHLNRNVAGAAKTAVKKPIKPVEQKNSVRPKSNEKTDISKALEDDGFEEF